MITTNPGNPDIRKAGLSMIVVEQDLGKAMSVADRLICLRQGRVTLARPAAEITRDDVEAAYFGTSETVARALRKFWSRVFCRAGLMRCCPPGFRWSSASCGWST